MHLLRTVPDHCITGKGVHYLIKYMISQCLTGKKVVEFQEKELFDM